MTARRRAQRRDDPTGSTLLLALLQAVSHAGVERGREREVVGCVLEEFRERTTSAHWREVIGWLPADVRALVGPSQGTPVAPQHSLATAVHVTAGIPLDTSVRATAAVLQKLSLVAPADPGAAGSADAHGDQVGA